MQENSRQLDKLLEQLEILQKRQEMFSREIFHLRTEVARLKGAESKSAVEPATIEQNPGVPGVESGEIAREPGQVPVETPVREYREEIIADVPEEAQEEHSSLEKFIGENLINKIGIAITVIGVSIGVKYTIDHDLISPLMRIILGYLAGFILLGIGIRLKKAYTNYSAVLVSGSMATLYFMTYAAFTFYALIPQLAAFLIMVAITACAVYAALQYDRQVIAHIGLVGAYAIPFILSSDPGQAAILFSYIAIINIGILAISLYKYWEPLYVLSFLLTWLIYFSWFNSTQSVGHFNLAFLFNGIFFATFYLTYLAYKVRNRDNFDIPDIILLLVNSTIFYGVGYSLLKTEPGMEWFLGTFTIINATIHFLVMLLVIYRKISDKNLFYFIQGLALVFVTIAIPVQFKGNWITLLWATEAAMLFWIGRVRKGIVYEILSYPLMIALVISLLRNWATGYFNPDYAQQYLPLLNEFFLASLFSIGSLGLIYLIDNDEKYPSGIEDREDLLRTISILIPSVLLVLLFFSFRNEIASYFDQYHKEQNEFKTIWLINYSLFFFSALALVNIYKIKSQALGFVNLAFNVVVIVSYLTAGLIMMGILRKHYLSQTGMMGSHPDDFCIWIRYISLVFFVVLLYCCRELSRQGFLQIDLTRHYDILLHLSVVWILSSELVNWMTIAGSTQSFKLGLSILWGIYALLIVILGIWKKKKHLRIGAIVLFGATLLKLFFYDLSNLDTISKTIVFVSLGVLLLIISFLYNKYTSMIND